MMNAPKLFDHQRRATEFALRNDGCCALFAAIGTGKTLMALNIFSELKKKTPPLRLLVVCPLSLIEVAWRDDVRKFSGFLFRSLRDKGDSSSRADICAVNYESMIARKMFDHVIGMVQGGPWMIVLDESSRIKSHSAKITKTLLFMRDRFKHRIILSGTPAPNNEQEYWAQITFVGSGIFPGRFFSFRNKFFHLGRNGAVLPNGSIISKDSARKIFSQGWSYQITDASRKELMRSMAPVCFWARREDCFDLPDTIDEVRSVVLSAEQARVYREMRRTLVAEIDGAIVTATVALARIMKLREITSGFLIAEKDTIPFKENPKLAELMAVLAEAGDEQAVIWCEFRREVQDLQAALGTNAVYLHGGVTDKETPIRDFQSGKVKYIVANSQSLAHGVTLTNCHIQVFYSLSYSYERYEQARGRTLRYGQKNQCLYVHLLAKGTIDEILYTVVREKRDAQDAVRLFHERG